MTLCPPIRWLLQTQYSLKTRLFTSSGVRGWWKGHWSVSGYQGKADCLQPESAHSTKALPRSMQSTLNSLMLLSFYWQKAKRGGRLRMPYMSVFRSSTPALSGWEWQVSDFPATPLQLDRDGSGNKTGLGQL